MMTELTRFAGVVLAGGQSRRMGTDKAQLPLEGQPLIDHARQVLTIAGVGDVLVSGRDTTPDDRPDRGPVGGIATMIRRLADRFDGVLFVPVDMPAVNAATLLALVQATGDGAHYRDHPLPLFLRLTPAVTAAAQAEASGDEPQSVRAFLSRLEISLLPVTPAVAAALVNVNTPQDWADYLARRNGQAQQ